MKIDGGRLPKAVELYGSVNKGPQPKLEPAGKPPAQADSVELSPAAREVKGLKAKLDELPEVRQERVDAIRKAIADGTYKVSADRVAGRMLDAGAMDDPK